MNTRKNIGGCPQEQIVKQKKNKENTFSNLIYSEPQYTPKEHTKILELNPMPPRGGSRLVIVFNLKWISLTS